ncbi:DUF6049 family protein [Microbacterium luticocti]|uniref:DUF6049 family protein n=1 Tax=Microbacterium luticocti TaxID=451764 RepID=UPI0003F6EAF5|nr:DUF6049 family protein [Microbacterium luticocti]
MSVTDPDPVTRASQAAAERPPADPRACADRTGRPRSRRHTRSPRTSPRTSRRSAILGAIAVATAVLLSPLASASGLGTAGALPAAVADDATPTPTPTPTLSGRVDAYLSPTDNGVLRAGRALSVWAALRNGTDSTLSPASVSLRIDTHPIADRAALATWLSTTTARSGMKALGEASIDPVASGEVGRTMVTVPEDDPVLGALGPGVYPLAATITGAGPARTVTSVIVVPDPDAKHRTPVGLVVPITAGALGTGLLGADELEALTAPDGLLTAELNAVAGTSAILAVDPAVPAAIRVLGSSAPRSATDWLDRLTMLSNERFALQFGDAGVAVQTRSGRTSLLQPTSLQSYMSPEDFATAPTPPPGQSPTPTATPTPDQTPSPAPGGPTYPTLEALQYLGPNTRGAVLWPFSGTAGAKDVTTLGAISADGTPSLTLIPSDTAGAGATGAAPARGRAGTADVLVYDTAVSDALRTASTEDDPAVRGSSLSAATAYLELAPHTTGSAPLLAVIDRSATRSGLGLSAAVEAVTRAPDTSTATLSELSAASAHPVTVGDGVVDPARVNALDGLLSDERTLTTFASILDDPSLLTGPERAAILQLIGGGWLDEAAGWRDALAQHRTATQQTLNAVSLAPSSDVNLAGTVASLQFGVRNELPWPVNLSLIVHPDDLRLEVQTTTTVVAHASSTTTVRVPVRARIGSGEVTLDLQLRSPTGVRIGESRSVAVTVHADWEQIGLVVLGVAVGAFLVIGLIRMIITRRRRTDGEGTDATGPGADPDAGTRTDPDTGTPGGSGSHPGTPTGAARDVDETPDTGGASDTDAGTDAPDAGDAHDDGTTR